MNVTLRDALGLRQVSKNKVQEILGFSTNSKDFLGIKMANDNPSRQNLEYCLSKTNPSAKEILADMKKLAVRYAKLIWQRIDLIFK